MAENDATAFRPEIARRTPELPNMQRPVAASAGGPVAPSPHKAPVEEKTLIVGRNIELSGQITACDRLVVEGKVDATLSDCRAIEIAASGVFNGSVEIEEAVIGGTFDGKLICRGRLLVRGTGKISGEIRYGQLEIELGGEVVGQISTTGKAPSPVSAPSPTSVPAPAVPAAV